MSKAASPLLVGEILVDEFGDQGLPGGAPFNVARSLAALGQPPRLVTRLGEDGHGERLVRELQAFGLPPLGVQRDGRHASGRVSVVEDAPGQHRFVIHGDAAWDHVQSGPALAALRAAPTPLFYFGTLAQRGEGTRRTVQALLDALPTDCLRYLDLNLRDGLPQRELAQLNLPRTDWLKINEDELQRLLRWFVPGLAPGDAGLAARPLAALQPALGALMARFDLKRVILTLGTRGYACFDAPGRLVAQGGGQAVAVVDTVGAGDGFSAMLLAAHLRGWPIAPALALANRYAAALCGQRGPVPAADSGFFAHWRETLDAGPAATQETAA